jgi:hypothetical protein
MIYLNRLFENKHKILRTQNGQLSHKGHGSYAKIPFFSDGLRHTVYEYGSAAYS